ncbi:hypothetical protein F4802DRAFT_343778 [Xylaria palmicola]|nr:hypothetical protein F4802DRAFT_343778 [Xylaria palmicola]
MSLISDHAWYQPRRSAAQFDEPSQPWTTARCHRLLRPLISRIGALRKESSVAGLATVTALKPTSANIPVSSSNRRKPREPFAESDCLMPRKKRPRLTYSQRRGANAAQTQNGGPDQSHPGQGSHNEDTNPALGTKPSVKKAFRSIQPEGERKSTSPGEIVASTPVLRRARGEIVLSPVARVHELDLRPNQAGPDCGHRTKAGSSAQRRLEDRLLSLRERSSRFPDLEAIYRSFEALLKATATSATHNGRVASGPRSLLDMCLRKVPQYISELEAWERLDAEASGTVSTLDDINTSAQIYNELESLGTGVGWRHLRVVVRADGLSAVKRGIEEALCDDELSQLLVDLCVQLGAVSEAEDLLAALVNRQYPQPLHTESCFTQVATFQPLVFLNAFASQTQDTSFLLGQYSMLLSSGSLPTDWLATSEFERIWSLAVQGLASTNPSYDAIHFIAQSVSLLCRRKRMFTGNSDALQLEKDMAKASERTLMSVLGILASMSLLGETERGVSCLPESDIRRITIIGNRLKYIIRACIHWLGSHIRGRGNQKLELLYLALFLSSGQIKSERIENYVRGSVGKLSLSNVTSMSTKDVRARNHYDSVAGLIASIARACGRGTSVASHQCLDGLFKHLEPLELNRTLLGNLKAAAAFLIAQQTNNVKDLIYAESLHWHGQPSSGATSRQQSRDTLFTGYCWEETIGEWVTVSPVMNKCRAPTIKRRLRQSIGTEGTESLNTCSGNPSSPVPDRVLDVADAADVATCLDQGMDDCEQSTDERSRGACNEQSTMLMKKRPRRLRSTGALTTALVAKELAPQKSIPTSTSSKGRTDPDKENRVRLLAKKPRRSSGRIVLGARIASRDSIGRGDRCRQDGALSDDELCI